MLHSLTTNKASFKPIPFQEGLNIVVAKKAEKSEDNKTRNSLGKTTLLNIINFCLGNDPAAAVASVWSRNLQGWEFTLEATISGSRVKITRGISDPDIIKIKGDISNWPDLNDGFLALEGDLTISVKTWRIFLGQFFFNLPEADVNQQEHPSYEELINYFVRINYESEKRPVERFGFRVEMSIAYLMGLNWEYIVKLNELRNRKSEANTLANAAKLDARRMGNTIEQLRSQCKIMRHNIEAQRQELEKYNVQPVYDEIKKEADEITDRLLKLSNERSSNQTRLREAKRALRRISNSCKPVNDLYEEAGITFGDQVKKRLDEVCDFHRRVSLNRREYFEEQIEDLEKKIEKSLEEEELLQSRKLKCMETLSISGALSQHVKLVEAYQEKLNELSEKERCLEQMRRADEDKEKIKTEEEALAKEAAEVYANLDKVRNSAKEFFARLTGILYTKPGELNLQLIDEGSRLGFSFWSKIPCDDSSGIKKMRVFAFDVTMLNQQRVCVRPIDFLVHDSSIFDATDPRQVALGLKEVKEFCRQNNCQYICMMNSNNAAGDEFKSIFSPEELKAATVRELSDDKPENSLLGIRFE